jgi:hypothetical protein
MDVDTIEKWSGEALLVTGYDGRGAGPFFLVVTVVPAPASVHATVHILPNESRLGGGSLAVEASIGTCLDGACMGAGSAKRLHREKYELEWNGGFSGSARGRSIRESGCAPADSAGVRVAGHRYV